MSCDFLGKLNAGDMVLHCLSVNRRERAAAETQKSSAGLWGELWIFLQNFGTPCTNWMVSFCWEVLSWVLKPVIHFELNLIFFSVHVLCFMMFFIVFSILWFCHDFSVSVTNKATAGCQLACHLVRRKELCRLTWLGTAFVPMSMEYSAKKRTVV